MMPSFCVVLRNHNATLHLPGCQISCPQGCTASCFEEIGSGSTDGGAPFLGYTLPPTMAIAALHVTALRQGFSVLGLSARRDCEKRLNQSVARNIFRFVRHALAGGLAMRQSVGPGPFPFTLQHLVVLRCVGRISLLIVRWQGPVPWWPTQKEQAWTTTV